MNEYRCSRCGGYEFRVNTQPVSKDPALLVLVVCQKPGCAHGVEATTVTEAFQKIAKKDEAE